MQRREKEKEGLPQEVDRCASVLGQLEDMASEDIYIGTDSVNSIS